MNLNLEIKPSRQGELDYLCGIYSLVNAVAYLYEGNVRRRYLKQSLLQTYEVKWPLNELLKEGMNEDEIDYLIEQGLMKGRHHHQHPVMVSKPYLNVRPPKIMCLLNELKHYLNSKNHRRIVLLAISNHWSLIHAVDEERVHFFDSTGKKTGYRRSFSWFEGRTRYQVYPEAIYFIEMGESHNEAL